MIKITLKVIGRTKQYVASSDRALIDLLRTTCTLPESTTGQCLRVFSGV